MFIHFFGGGWQKKAREIMEIPWKSGLEVSNSGNPASNMTRKNSAKYIYSNSLRSFYNTETTKKKKRLLHLQ